VDFGFLTRSVKPLKHPVAWFSMVYAMLIMVAVVSLLPAPDMGGSDKVLHLLTYFVLAAAFSTLSRHGRQIIWIATGLICFGVMLEILQGFTGYRMMDLQDMLANSAGVLAGLMLRLTPLPEWFRELEKRWF
jgi:VanZ family protein